TRSSPTPGRASWTRPRTWTRSSTPATSAPRTSARTRTPEARYRRVGRGVRGSGGSAACRWAGVMDTAEVVRIVAAAHGAAAGEAGVDDPTLGHAAHTEIGNSYRLLRLYELADPQHRAAYELGLLADPGGVAPAIIQSNLAELHLTWALELYRVGEVAEAEKHGLIAESQAMLAARHAPDGY